MPVPYTFNLLASPWLPVRRASGQREVIGPADLTRSIEADPIVDIDWPRADFRTATLEFLIGLLAVACPPTDNTDWLRHWNAPPSPQELAGALAPLAPTFVFEGDGPRAYQDFEDLITEPSRVEALLIEAPGGQTLRNNADLLVKAGRVEVLSRAAAAAAVLTLQTMAPAGGAGIRTSLRGGGPLTTLVVPATRPSLWHKLWANVPLDDEPAEPEDYPRIFPWLVPTRTSGKDGRTTTPDDVDMRQMYFGLPRRIRLDFEPNVEGAACDLTGLVDDVIVRTYRTRPSGTNYEEWGGRHPLTPHYRQKASDLTLYPVHGQGGRIGYRQWVAMLYGDQEQTRVPADCVKDFVTIRDLNLPRAERGFRLSAGGYDMDNMKARDFSEAETPVIAAPEDVELVRKQAHAFVAAANIVAGSLGQAVKIALYGEGAEVGNDKTPIANARERLWADTNDAFFRMLNEISRGSTVSAGEPDSSPAARWRSELHNAALAIFDDLTPIEDARTPELERLVNARRFLVWTLTGFGKRGAELFKGLGLDAPESKSKKAKGKGR